MALAGCASPVPASQQPVSNEPPASIAPSDPAATPRGAESGTEAIDAYALCKAQTLAIIAPAELAGIFWAPFEDATWLLREDGAIGIYIEATNENKAQGGEGREVALQCKVGGTLGEPVWLDFGVGSREADRDTILDVLARTDQA